MNKEVLEQLLKKNPSTERNDFYTLFHFAVAMMKIAGVIFFSPGASSGRRFIYWFNSHFWSEDFRAPAFEKQDFIFKEVFAILNEHGKVQLANPNDTLSAENFEIENGELLTDIGKSYLTTIYPLNSKKVIFF